MLASLVLDKLFSWKLAALFYQESETRISRQGISQAILSIEELDALVPEVEEQEYRDKSYSDCCGGSDETQGDRLLARVKTLLAEINELEENEVET